MCDSATLSWVCLLLVTSLLSVCYISVFLLHSILKNVHDAAEGFVWVYVKVATICSLLNGWRGMIVEKSVSHILSCQSYEDAFGLYPDLEAHEFCSDLIFGTGGGTYCPC
uniref:Prenyltransferase alpha-alpha toroid domain-containing protein n=1 Tax=Physcomitrium patens TaxID=3218 RepID=A0A7I4B2C8_PHYPA